jgi:hypothetical protein
MAIVFVLSEPIAVISSTLQVPAQQSTDGRDSEHRGPAVVANGPVSWNRGDCFCAGLIVFRRLAGTCTTIDWSARFRAPWASCRCFKNCELENRRRCVCVGLNRRDVLVVFVDFCSYLHNNQLTGTIPISAGQLPSLTLWYDFVVPCRPPLIPSAVVSSRRAW